MCKLALNMILVPADRVKIITWKNVLDKGSKKPLSLRVHVTWPCMPNIMFPVFFISPLSMIIILFAIRKDVPLYIHFTSIKTEQQYRTPLLQLLPSGEYFSTKILQGIHFNIHTKLLNLVSLLVNCCKLIVIWINENLMKQHV